MTSTTDQPAATRAQATSDPHAGPVPKSALRADAATRGRGRVQMLNATKPGGLDGWTLDLPRYELLRQHVLDSIDALAGDDGAVSLPEIVAAAQAQYATHPLFPGGRLRNYVNFTTIDLEARCTIERIPGESPVRIRRWSGAFDAAQAA